MITKQQAMECDEFHVEGKCTRYIGKRGGITEHREVWRRNGKTKTWKRNLERFRIPVKFGLYGYDCITENDVELVHAPEDCPLNDSEYVTK